MVDLGEDEEKFESFMAPITSKCFYCFYSHGVKHSVTWCEKVVRRVSTSAISTEELP